MNDWTIVDTIQRAVRHEALPEGVKPSTNAIKGLGPIGHQYRNGGWHPYARPQPSSAQIKNEIVKATQRRLDDFAKTREYDGMLSLCTYATSTNQKFAAEGQYGVEARDATWAKLYEILAEVEAGSRPMPTGYKAIESDLPKLEWPPL